MPGTTIRGIKMLHARSHTGVSVTLWQRAARAGAALSLAGALAFPVAAGATGTPTTTPTPGTCPPGLDLVVATGNQVERDENGNTFVCASRSRSEREGPAQDDRL